MIIKTYQDKKKIESILKMVEITLEMIQTLNSQKFATLITKDYYEVIRELITVLLLQDGYKTVGEGAHKELIEYVVKQNFSFSPEEIILIKELRIIRNKVAYDGFFVQLDYLEENQSIIKGIIKKLKEIINQRL